MPILLKLYIKFSKHPILKSDHPAWKKKSDNHTHARWQINRLVVFLTSDKLIISKPKHHYSFKKQKNL